MLLSKGYEAFHANLYGELQTKYMVMSCKELAINLSEQEADWFSHENHIDEMLLLKVCLVLLHT